MFFLHLGNSLSLLTSDMLPFIANGNRRTHFSLLPWSPKKLRVQNRATQSLDHLKWLLPFLLSSSLILDVQYYTDLFFFFFAHVSFLISLLKFALGVFVIKTMNNLVKFLNSLLAKKVRTGFLTDCSKCPETAQSWGSPRKWGTGGQRLFKNKDFSLFIIYENIKGKFSYKDWLI